MTAEDRRQVLDLPAPGGLPAGMHSIAEPTPRGELIDLGGRRLHVVREEKGRGPLVLLEHGAFGCAADWAVVQERLAAEGRRSLAYDRAGLGFSDPGPAPRDGGALVADLELLLRTLGERGPYVVVGHSMGGLMARLFVLAHPRATLGVVLADAVMPKITELPAGLRAVRAYGRAMRLVGLGARAGLMRPWARLMGDQIGLTPSASAEKRWIYGSASHAKGAAQEVAQWPVIARQAGARAFPPDLPVAVVTAGMAPGRAWLRKIQAAPAEASRRGRVEHVPGATHANLLGRRFADHLVRGVEHVLATGGD